MVEKIVKKKWGHEKIIANFPEYCGKILILNKGFRCSYHMHKLKKETFHILRGKVLMETDKGKMIMQPGSSIHIKPGTKHRFTGLEDSEIIEFSTHHEDSDSYREPGMLSGAVELDESGLPK